MGGGLERGVEGKRKRRKRVIIKREKDGRRVRKRSRR